MSTIAFKSRLLAGAALVAGLVFTPSLVMAQDAQPDEGVEVDEIVVTGIRGSLRASIEQKRDAANITDVITATDIGKLPDENVADSLQRVTGVQISRESGEGRSANIRGLAATTYINGRSAASPGNTRDFDLRNLTADFFEAVEVNKSVLASQPEGTLGGSINLVTRKPLSFSERTVSLGLEGTYSDYIEQTDPRASLFLTDRFGDFGASLGVSYNRRSIRQDVAFSQSGMQIGQAPTDTGFDFNRDGVSRDYIRPNDYRFMSQLSERERIGGDLTLQWRPAEDWLLRLDGTAAKLTNDTYESFLSALNGFAPANASNLVIDGNGALQSGTFRNSAVNVDGRYRPEVYKTQTLGFNAQWTPGDWTLALDASTSTGRYQEFSQILRFGGPLGTVNYTAGGDDGPAGIDIRTAAGAPYDFFAPAQFVPNLTFDRDTRQRQRNNVVSLDAKYTVSDSIFTNVRAGARFSDFNFTASVENVGNEFNDVTNPAFFGPGGVRLNASQSPLNQLTNATFRSDGGFFRDASGVFPRTWLTGLHPGADPDSGSAEFTRLLNLGSRRVLSPLSVADVEEKTQGAYVTTDIDTELFGLRTRANLGVRVVNTDLTSRGLDSSSRPIVRENSYTDVLPAANVRFDLSEDLLLRLAAAKVLQRADLVDLTTSFNVIPGAGSATIGNPTLQPYEATEFNVALEWYFSDEGLLSATLFYKDVKNFLISSTTLAEIPGFVPLNRPPGDPLGNQFFITQRVNGADATIQGVELSYQQPFTFLPPSLEGFGTVLNYTFSDAETSNGAPYEGLAEHTFNIIGYFERGPINARLAYNYRSETAQTIGANLNANVLGSNLAADGKPIGLYQFLIPQGYLDASFSYQFTDGFRVVLEAINLTDEQMVHYVGEESTVNEVYKTDRRVSLGLKLTF